MKIVVLGLRGFPNVQGGVETHCENMYPLIVAQGHEVIVLARSPYVGKNSYEYKGVTILPIFCPKQKFLEAIVHTFFGVLKAKQLRPDVLHIHAVGPNIMTPLARLLGMKVVMTHHGPDYERKKWGGFAKMVLKLGEWGGCKFANKVICIAKNIADEVKKKYGVDSVIIPNGVVIPERVESIAALKEFGLERGKYIVAVGRFVPEKGFHELIEAWQSLVNEPFMQRLGWKLAIVGGADHEDDYSRNLKQLAARSERVVMTGFQKGLALKELYAHAGLFILPSHYEGLPIVLLEALSYGLNCIVSDIPANRNVPLDNARFFTPGDVEGMAEHIEQFASAPLSESERAAQLKLINDNYNWPSIAASTCDVYKSL